MTYSEAHSKLVNDVRNSASELVRILSDEELVNPSFREYASTMNELQGNIEDLWKLKACADFFLEDPTEAPTQEERG